MSFTFDDLNDELFEKVIAFSYRIGTGMGGPGIIILLTSDGMDYRIGQEGFEGNWLTPSKYFPFMADKERWIESQYVLTRYWYSVSLRDKLKHSEGKLLKEYKEKTRECPWWTDFVWDAAGIDADSVEAIIYDKTKQIWDEQKRRKKELEEHRDRVRLHADDVEWKELYDDNYVPEERKESIWHQVGYYALLFRYKDKDNAKTIMGVMLTIEFQREQIEPGGYYSDAPIERYNVFYHEFEDVKGDLFIPVFSGNSPMEPFNNKKDGQLIYTDVNIRDTFVRSCATLEEAKENAMFRLEVWGGITKENVIYISS